MKEQKEAIEVIDELKTQLKEYAELRLALFKVESTGQLAKSTGQLFSYLVILFLLFFVLLFFSLVSGFYFANLLGSSIAGFGVIALLYLLLALFALAFRKTLIANPLTNVIVSTIYQEEE